MDEPLTRTVFERIPVARRVHVEVSRIEPSRYPVSLTVYAPSRNGGRIEPTVRRIRLRADSLPRLRDALERMELDMAGAGPGVRA